MKANQAPPQLTQLVYASRAESSVSQAAILEILDRARVKNASLGVTGMLLYCEGSFFQVLEGVPDVVETLFDRIGRDRRHSAVTKLLRTAVAERGFPQWSMGYSKISRQELAGVPGLNDFFEAGSALHSLPEGPARRLLEAFREGRWRSHVLP